MGSRPREQIVPEAARARIAEDSRGRFEGAPAVSLVLADGIVAGTWRRRKRGKTVELEVEPFRRLTRAERQGLDDEAARVGAFLGSDVALRASR